MEWHAQFLIGESERMEIQLVAGPAEASLEDEHLRPLRYPVKRKVILAQELSLAIADDPR
jgi:hypothetical protein